MAGHPISLVYFYHTLENVENTFLTPFLARFGRSSTTDVTQFW